MILIQLHEAGFGITPTPNGCMVNYQDPQSGIGVQVPHSSDSVVLVVKALAQCLNEDQKRECMTAFTSGIHLPGSDFDPSKLGMNQDGPPR